MFSLRIASSANANAGRFFLRVSFFQVAYRGFRIRRRAIFLTNLTSGKQSRGHVSIHHTNYQLLEPFFSFSPLIPKLSFLPRYNSEATASFVSPNINCAALNQITVRRLERMDRERIYKRKEADKRYYSEGIQEMQGEVQREHLFIHDGRKNKMPCNRGGSFLISPVIRNRLSK